ncbi:allantoate deiminase [Facklamia miroungae]|uniref:Allantoate deiminase n=1 Tax=Facklamia miroungae TaxID=120956 RepID=A0A1G7V033_9LACT|nr:allantoate deiminase [Facklamia miroungae]NKZ30209.1 allantoate deiminase [Facklamia miroungae]SDG52861.1 allantoate deiminase [Facklamia miroungae]
MLNISPAEIDRQMDWISSISDKEGKGTTRLLYSESWVEAQKALKELFEKAKMKVEFDAVGNMFATVEGSETPESIIASGSHIDTVVDGGRLDGQLGIMAAYLAIKGLVEKYGQPKKSLRIVSMAEEEGSRFPYAFWGSKNIFGLAKKEDVENIKDNEGIPFETAMREAGFDYLSEKPHFNKMDAFVELHIEQGNFLEKAEKKVGIVNAIVGQKRYTVKLKGEANHAGTTLMKYRKDVVDCYARIVAEIIDKANEIGDPLVVTFGHVEIIPNVVNVVPGEMEFSIDTRHTDQKALDDFAKFIEATITKHTQEREIKLEMNLWMNEPPVPMDQKIVDVLEKVCQTNKLNYQVMHSGAGHDSQIFAPQVPTAMIFVPSINGISHNPEEHTEAVDIVQGIQALAEALKELAY